MSDTAAASEGYLPTSKVVSMRGARLGHDDAASRHEREVLHKDLLNALPAAIYTTDAAGRITFYNEAAVAFSGRRPVIGSDEWCVTWRLYNGDGTPMPHDQCPMAVALREGREVRGAEAIAERPDGSRVWFTPYPTPLRDERGDVIGAVNMLVDITTRKEAEAHQELLINEVNHRANNLLTIVQAALRLTQASTVEDFRLAMEGRITALAHAHKLLAVSRWTSADLQHLVTEELAAFRGDGEPRVWVSGPILSLGPQEAQCVAMALHELATNAAKYGALSSERGQLKVEWRVKAGFVELKWREEGGPPVAPPTRQGVGSKVMTVTLAQIGGQIDFDWRAEGLHCLIRLPARG